MGDVGFMVNVSCPHCGKHLVKSYTGFSGIFSQRKHGCKYCNAEFYLTCVFEVSTEPSIEDGAVASVKALIKYLKGKRRKQHLELLEERERVRRIVREMEFEAEQLSIDRSLKAHTN